jgi:hypothetical protein
MNIMVRVYNELKAFETTIHGNFPKTDWLAVEMEFGAFTGAVAAMGAFIEVQDTVSIADLILYEIMPVLEKVYGTLGEHIRVEKEESS